MLCMFLNRVLEGKWFEGHLFFLWVSHHHLWVQLWGAAAKPHYFCNGNRGSLTGWFVKGLESGFLWTPLSQISVLDPYLAIKSILFTTASSLEQSKWFLEGDFSWWCRFLLWFLFPSVLFDVPGGCCWSSFDSSSSCSTPPLLIVSLQWKCALFVHLPTPCVWCLTVKYLLKSQRCSPQQREGEMREGDWHQVLLVHVYIFYVFCLNHHWVKSTYQVTCTPLYISVS